MVADVRCQKCKAVVPLSNVPVEFRAEIANFVRHGSRVEATRYLRQQTFMPLPEAKAVVMHLSRTQGCCQACNSEIGAGEIVQCPKCRALTIAW